MYSFLHWCSDFSGKVLDSAWNGPERIASAGVNRRKTFYGREIFNRR